MKRLTTTLLASAVLLAATASPFAAEAAPHFSPLKSDVNYSQYTIASRNVATYNNGYDVFFGFWNGLDTSGALVYLNKSKDSDALPELKTLDVPNVVNTDGTTSAKGVTYRTYADNDTLYVAVTQGKYAKSGAWDYDDRGQYALFEAKINPETGVPSAFTTIAQTGQHGLPGQLKSGASDFNHGFVLWFGTVANNTTSPTTYLPTVVFANPYEGTDTGSVSIYQKQTDNGDEWHKVATYPTKAKFDMPDEGIQSIQPLQVVANTQGTVLLFPQSTLSNGSYDLFDIHFDRTGNPTGIKALPLPSATGGNRPAQDQFSDVNYDPQTQKAYITLDHQGLYSFPASELFTDPVTISWTHEYTTQDGQILSSAAPLLHSAQSNAFNAVYWASPKAYSASAGKCVVGSACTEYTKTVNLVGNSAVFNVLNNTYLTAGGVVEAYESE